MAVGESGDTAAQVEAVIEAAIDGIITINASGTVERVNSAALAMLGYRREEMLGRNLKMIMPEPYRSEHDSYLQHYAETGERRIIGITRELPVLRKDGTTFPIELSVSQVDRDPEPFYLGIIRDVSERAAVTGALKASEERLALAIEGANEGLWDWRDVSRDGQWWSPTFYRLLGYEPGEMEASQSRLIEMLHPFDRARVIARFEQQDDPGAPLDLEFRMRMRDGSYRWFRALARVYRTAGDGPPRMAGTLQDIHSQKMAEFSRAEYEERLRSTVDELDRFAYIASHDLKAPLRAIDNLAKWVVEDSGDALPEKPRQYLEKMQGRIERMERLLEDLLRYSRVGRSRGEVRAANLRALVAEVCEMSNIPEGFSVVVDMPAGPVYTYITPLKHVFQNLINNAVRHHDSDRGTIEIRGEVADSDLLVMVRDDGPGIPENLREKAFALFQTLRPRDEVDSTGLGLAIVKKLAAAAGGEVYIEGHTGRGTTFRLTWPLENGPGGNA